MFFYLSKILGFLISPLIWIIGLLVFSFLFPKKGKRLILYSLLAIFVFGNGFLFDEATRLWETQAYQLKEKETFDLAIILGGYSSFDPSINMIEFHEASDRLIHGINLYQQNKASKILISGGSGSMVGVDQEGVYMYPFLVDFGIKKKDLWVDSLSKNTHENAVFSKKILEENNFNGSILLITSAMHMPRAEACFNKLNIDVTPFAVDRLAGERKYYFDHLFIPNLHTMHKWKSFFHEILGLVIYKIQGYA